MLKKIKRTNLILKLLEQNTNLAIVRKFLKEHGLHHSAGSWEDIRTKRILPAIEENKLQISDLEDLLINTEEVGKQHIFMYSCSQLRAKDILKTNNIEKISNDLGLKTVYESSKIIETSQHATISDIRLSDTPCLTLKIIQTRWHTEYIGEEISGDLITKQWRKVSERAVNIARLHKDGFLEIRIASQSNSTKYDYELNNIWEIIDPFISRKFFSEISLRRAKDKLLSEKDVLKDKIRYSTTTLINDIGNSVRAAVGSFEDDLSDDLGIKGSIEAFINHNGYCEHTNIWILKSGASMSLSNDIHVLLSGMINEFAIPANCISEDYEYVLKQIRELNE